MIIYFRNEAKSQSAHQEGAAASHAVAHSAEIPAPRVNEQPAGGVLSA